MIAINLLPEDRRPVERTPLPRLLVILAGVAGLCLEIAVLLNLALFRYPGAEQERARQRVKQDELKKQEKRVKEVDKEIARVKHRGDSIQKILKYRRVWAPILYRLSDPEVLPASVWFRKVKLAKPTRSGRPGAGAPSLCLVIEAYAQGPDSSTMLLELSGFERNLRKLDDWFPDDFDFDKAPPTVTGIQRKDLASGKDTAIDVPEQAIAFTVTIPLKAISTKAPKKSAR